MHSQVDYNEFLRDMSGVLGGYYIALALLNFAAAWWLWRGQRTRALGRVRPWRGTSAALWLIVGLFYAALVPIALSGDPHWMQWITLPLSWRDLLDRLLGPVVLSVGLVVGFFVFLKGRRFFVRPAVAWTVLNLFLFWMGLSLLDRDFAAIIGKPDNVPIVGMVLLTGFFTWLATWRAVRNDQRLAAGRPPEEAEASETVLVWPDLVYIELICMVAVTAVLIVWSIEIKAPLEGPASVMQTPNPSKAPWYFVGLQELLVYFDPWMAGVVIPCLIIFGLLAIPYLDKNECGNGYYTIAQRKFAYVVFQFGFLLLWLAMILIGTFMRGPNWNFFGLYQTWDPHKAQLLNNVNLSDYYWVQFRGMPLPTAPAGASEAVRVGYVLLREAPGLIFLTLYFFGLPPLLLLVSQRVRGLYRQLGVIRFVILAALLLIMALVPIKMICRWSFNLKYIVAIPELLLNL